MDLKKEVEALVGKWVNENRSFTAFDVTTFFRKNYSGVKFNHPDVRDLVHKFMESPRPGYNSRVAIKDGNKRATEYFSINTAKQTSQLAPKSTSVTNQINLPPFVKLSYSSSNNLVSFPVAVDGLNRVYIPKRKLNKLGIKASSQYRLYKTSYGYTLDFNSTSPKSIVSNRGYVRFLNQHTFKTFNAVFNTNTMIMDLIDSNITVSSNQPNTVVLPKTANVTLGYVKVDAQNRVYFSKQFVNKHIPELHKVTYSPVFKNGVLSVVLNAGKHILSSRGYARFKNLGSKTKYQVSRTASGDLVLE